MGCGENRYTIITMMVCIDNNVIRLFCFEEAIGYAGSWDF